MENIEAWQLGVGVVIAFLIYWGFFRKRKDASGSGKPGAKKNRF